MTSWDYFVGFEREPRDLDNFLEAHGYNRVLNKEDNSVKNYYSRKGGLIDLFYSSKLSNVNKDEVPDWSKSGSKIISELMISTKEFNEVDEVLRMVKEATIKYNGIFYDYDLDDFFRGEDL